MTVPASPFVGRLLAEIANVRGGVPAAAAEMGVEPQVINAIARGDTVSTGDLNSVYSWLVNRVALGPREAEDYQRLRVAAREGTHWISPSSDPPDTQTGPEGGGRSGRTIREATLATVVVVLIITLTVVITIVIVRPGNSSSTGAEASASPSTASPPVPVPVTSSNPPASTVFPPPSPSPIVGKLIASYDNFKLSQYYYITFAAGGRPQPQKSGGDLFLYSTGEGGYFEVYNGTGALLSGTPLSFANCKADTAFGGTVRPVPQGDTICFQGHGVVAAAYVVNYASSGGIDYVTLDVRVWQDSSQSQGT